VSSATTATDAFPRIAWRRAEVVDKRPETPRAATLVLRVDGWGGHRAGQHVDVRLTDEDGYHAQRSYSVASAPEDGSLALAVERLENGEVSPYLVDEARAGDEFELRGPLGGWFIWNAADGGPLLLVAGGSGVVPLVSMLRHRRNAGSDVPARLLISARNLDEFLYRHELEELDGADDGVELFATLTREQPEGWSGYSRRIDRDMLEDVAWPADAGPRAYICGPTSFVEAAAAHLVELGHAPDRIKTERFGATGP
jgi:ferredoxin-NADP reductase